MNFLNSIISFDYKIEVLIPQIRTDFWNTFFMYFTDLGYWLTITILCLITSAALYYYKERNLILPLFVAVLGSGIMALIIKFLVGRERPGGDIALYIEKLPSFPSAHAALIFAFLGFLAFCFFQFDLALKLKIFFSLIFGLIILLVGFSRVYLGVHYLSDVIAGYLVGLMWLFIAMHIS